MLHKPYKWKQTLIFTPIFTVFAFCFLLATAASASNIRVGLSTGVTGCELTVSQGEYQIKGGMTNQVLGVANAGDVIELTRQGSNYTVALNNSTLDTVGGSVAVTATDDSAANLIKYKGVRYRGSFGALSNGTIINVVDMEQYIRCVIGKEMGYSAPDEALKAQAVASRSYAYANSGGTYYDVKADTSSQVYGGYDAEVAANNSKVMAAVEATQNQVMYYDGTLVEAFFHSHAGGYTEDNENVWSGNALPYLRGVASPYDTQGSTVYDNWQVTYTPEQMKALAEKQMQRNGQSGSFGQFKELKLYTTKADNSGNTVSGRVTKAEIIGTGCTVAASKDAIRTFLGIKSTLFTATGLVSTVKATENLYIMNASGKKTSLPWKKFYAISKDGTKEQLGNLTNPTVITKDGTQALAGSASSSANVVISGKGNGHGVGMSQYGAMGMAKAGKEYQEILKLYYGGNNPSKLVFQEK